MIVTISSLNIFYIFFFTKWLLLEWEGPLRDLLVTPTFRNNVKKFFRNLHTDDVTYCVPLRGTSFRQIWQHSWKVLSPENSASNINGKMPADFANIEWRGNLHRSNKTHSTKILNTFMHEITFVGKQHVA